MKKTRILILATGLICQSISAGDAPNRQRMMAHLLQLQYLARIVTGLQESNKQMQMQTTAARLAVCGQSSETKTAQHKMPRAQTARSAMRRRDLR